MNSSDEPRTLQPAPRKFLYNTLFKDNNEVPVSREIPTATAPPKPVLSRPELRTNPVARQLPDAVDSPRADPAPSQPSAPPEIHTHDIPDSDMVDLYDDLGSLFSDLSEVVRESGNLDRITTLHHVLAAEREELLRRHEETTRALSRTKSQLDHVLSLTDEAIQTTAVFVDKEKARLETKKTAAEAKIERRKNLEVEQRRKAKELERIRQQEEERKAQIETEQQRRKEEASATERQHLAEVQAKESAQAEERRRFEQERSRIEEEGRWRLAEEDRRKRDEEEKKRHAEDQKEGERLRRKLSEEKDAMARKQEEDRRIQLIERRKLAEDEKRRKEVDVAAAKAEAEKEQQRIFQERRASALKDKYKNYNRPELGPSSAGSSSTLEGPQNSSSPAILVNDVPNNLQVSEHHPGLAKTNKTPTFVPASTEAGRLPPDLSRQVPSDSDVVKHETTSPVITPLDSTESMESSAPLPSRPISSMSTTAPAPAPAMLLAAPHLPQRPTTVYSQPPRSRHSARQSYSRSPSRSPRHRLPSRAPRSPESPRGRYPSPSRRHINVDHYSPPRQGSGYDSPSLSPSPKNPRKRALQDPWDRADTPSKLDYSHPSKRRTSNPHQSRSPPSPRLRSHGIPARRPPPINRRVRGTLEQRLSSRPPQHLSDRIN